VALDAILQAVVDGPDIQVDGPQRAEVASTPASRLYASTTPTPSRVSDTLVRST
jgi:hypothetical protein